MGQSGAGKSTLLNQISPELQLATAEISQSLGRGKHTTRHVELIPLYDGLVADTRDLVPSISWRWKQWNYQSNFLNLLPRPLTVSFVNVCTTKNRL